MCTSIYLLVKNTRSHYILPSIIIGGGVEWWAHLSQTLFPPDGAAAVELHQQRALLVQRPQLEVQRLLPVALSGRGLQRPSPPGQRRLARLLHLHLDEKHWCPDPERSASFSGGELAD